MSRGNNTLLHGERPEVRCPSGHLRTTHQMDAERDRMYATRRWYYAVHPDDHATREPSQEKSHQCCDKRSRMHAQTQDSCAHRRQCCAEIQDTHADLRTMMPQVTCISRQESTLAKKHDLLAWRYRTGSARYNRQIRPHGTLAQSTKALGPQDWWKTSSVSQQTTRH